MIEAPNGPRKPTVSIVIPVFDERERIVDALLALQSLRASQRAQVIVVDGGSTDDTVALAGPLADIVTRSARGRALQMNAGAAVASGDVLLFLHADTSLPEHCCELVIAGLTGPDQRRGSRSTSRHLHVWGRFDVRIEGRSRVLELVARAMNLRSRWSGIATGDQAMFVKREDFFSVGGFPLQPLMEDIEMSSRLKARSAPLCLTEQVTTSGRRWDTRGVWRTIFLMWRLRLLYWFGTPAEKLAEAYR